MANNTGGAQEQPKYLWGKPNPNWQGPKKATDASAEASAKSARSDFNTQSISNRVSVDNITIDTKLSDIDFGTADYEAPVEDYGDPSYGPSQTVMYPTEEGELYYSETWEENTVRRTLETLGYEDLLESYTEDELEEHLGETMDVYTDSLTSHLAASGVDVYYSDLGGGNGVWDMSTVEDLDDDTTMGDVWSKFDNANNSFLYRLPDDITDRVVAHAEENGVIQRLSAIDDGEYTFNEYDDDEPVRKFKITDFVD